MTEAEELAKCAWMEDRSGVGFGYCIMHVIMNRVKSPDFPNTIHDVIYQKNAFSWTRPDNPEYGLKPHGPIYDALVLSADYVIAGDDDPTGGALYYANLKHIDKGGWFDRNIVQRPDTHPLIIEIGQHSYYA